MWTMEDFKNNNILKDVNQSYMYILLYVNIMTEKYNKISFDYLGCYNSLQYILVTDLLLRNMRHPFKIIKSTWY